ncbi:MAG TPA: twin-arginine translocase subunit TatC, partial [Sphingomicrobium sp.]|nr:twin-arginine translocase subunit TatC [Sphingomicrobium sp.]
VLFFVGMYFAKPIFGFLVQPLLAAGQGKVIYTDVPEAFFVDVKVALFAALMAGFPFFAIQIWKFVAPGLYAKEKRALLPFLILTPFFFVGGAAFAYYVAMPWALHFLLGPHFQSEVGGVQREALPAVGNYLSFSTRFLFGFGVAFLTPILLMILERAGIIRLEHLTRYRRYAVVACAGVSAVLTPPDAVSMLLLMVPLYSLYELAIVAIRVTHWRSARNASSGSAGQSEGPEAPPGGGRVGGSGPI